MKKIMVGLVLVLSLVVIAKDYGDFSNVEIIKVYDGDTVVCNIKDLHPIIGEKIRIRLCDINAPEINDDRDDIQELAEQAKEYLSEAVKKAKKIELKKCSRDRYFRIDAQLWLDGVNIGQEMMNKGLVKKYGEVH